MEQKQEFIRNQPICRKCFNKRWPGREPIVVDAPVDACCDCGQYADDGIYIRVKSFDGEGVEL